MAQLDQRLQRWTVDVVAPGSAIIEMRGLRDGGSPWLIVLDRVESPREVILRVGAVDDRALLETEVAALAVARVHGISAPQLIAADVEGAPPKLLTSVVEGASTIPVERPTARLRRLGAEAARLHALDVPMTEALPRRDRSISGVDFVALRERETTPLLQRAEAITAHPPDNPIGFVHGDLWQGNAMWQDDELVALIDWDCAGVGPAGVDLGSLRCDAATAFGLDAAHDVLVGWEEEACRAADDVAFWDVVASLCTPTDMGWFAGAVAGQGRRDLTRLLLVERRDEFLKSALANLGD